MNSLSTFCCAAAIVGFGLLAPGLSYGEAAQGMQKQRIDIGANLAFISNEGPSGSDFDETFRGSGFVVLPMNDNIGFEAGLSQTSSTEDSGSDNTGEYKIEISSSDLFAGVRVQSNPLGRFRFYGRGGVLYYHSEIKFEESFYNIKPEGDEEEVEEGGGFYLGGGGALELNPRLHLTVEVSYLKRREYFEDSSQAFDMKEIGLAVGLIFRAF